MTITDVTRPRRGPAPQTRLSFDVLEEYVHARWGPDVNIQTGDEDRLVTDGFIALHCDVDRGVVLRWRQGGIPLYAADRAAIALGIHPNRLWPGYNTIDRYQEINSC